MKLEIQVTTFTSCNNNSNFNNNKSGYDLPTRRKEGRNIETKMKTLKKKKNYVKRQGARNDQWLKLKKYKTLKSEIVIDYLSNEKIVHRNKSFS